MFLIAITKYLMHVLFNSLVKQKCHKRKKTTVRLKLCSRDHHAQKEA